MAHMAHGTIACGEGQPSHGTIDIDPSPLLVILPVHVPKKSWFMIKTMLVFLRGNAHAGLHPRKKWLEDSYSL